LFPSAKTNFITGIVQDFHYSGHRALLPGVHGSRHCWYSGVYGRVLGYRLLALTLTCLFTLFYCFSLDDMPGTNAPLAPFRRCSLQHALPSGDAKAAWLVVWRLLQGVLRCCHA
jgi:hypothetical protein